MPDWLASSGGNEFMKKLAFESARVMFLVLHPPVNFHDIIPMVHETWPK